MLDDLLEKDGHVKTPWTYSLKATLIVKNY